MQSFHYFPLAWPFLLVLIFLVAVLILVVELKVLAYAYEKIGVGSRYVLTLLVFSLIGSYINIPVARLPEKEAVHEQELTFFGVRWVVPVISEYQPTLVAVNLGGAVIPAALSMYLILRNRLFFSSLIGVAAVTAIVHSLAYPVKGVGIATPVIVPPLAAALVAFVLSRRYIPALAYISGTLGTLIGADLLNLDKVQGLGAPIVSIGGAGTFDGVFLTGILAVLLT